MNSTMQGSGLFLTRVSNPSAVLYSSRLVTLHTPGAYGQCSAMLTSSRLSSGQDMWLDGLGMTNSKSGDYNIFSSG